MAADPTFLLVGKLGGGPNAHIIELSGYLSAYSPYIFYGEERQRLVSPFICVDEAAALEALVFLGEFRADFRQCLRFCNAYGYRVPSMVYFPEKGCHLGTNRSDNET